MLDEDRPQDGPQGRRGLVFCYPPRVKPQCVRHALVTISDVAALNVWMGSRVLCV